MTIAAQMPTNRAGRTHKLKVGAVSLYVTINRDADGVVREVFAKADEGHQAEADGLALMSSIAMRYGAPAAVVAKHLRYRRYEPRGGPGQPCSISDAIGLAIEREVGT